MYKLCTTVYTNSTDDATPFKPIPLFDIFFDDGFVCQDQLYSNAYGYNNTI
jgi:hypothetical protein